MGNEVVLDVSRPWVDVLGGGLSVYEIVTSCDEDIFLVLVCSNEGALNR